MAGNGRPVKRAGDQAELEAVRLLADLTGHEGRRLLGAGRKDDIGDLDFPALRTAIQVTRVLHPEKDLVSRLTSKLADAETQAARSGLPGAIVLARVSTPHNSVWWRAAWRGSEAHHYDAGICPPWALALYLPIGGDTVYLPNDVIVGDVGAWWDGWRMSIPRLQIRAHPPAAG